MAVGSAEVVAEIADTSALRGRGLSGRGSLSEERSILFVFPEPGRYGFWMPDMRFPIDIVWIDERHTVIGLTERVSPDSYPTVFYPPGPVSFLL